jgi:hypothetical protein
MKEDGKEEVDRWLDPSGFKILIPQASFCGVAQSQECTAWLVQVTTSIRNELGCTQWNWKHGDSPMVDILKTYYNNIET